MPTDPMQMNQDEERLHIIDELLSDEHVVVRSAYDLRDKINQRIQHAKPLSSTSHYLNLLTKLRDLLPKGVTIINPRKHDTERWKSGYSYSDRNYRHYLDLLDEECGEKALLMLARSFFYGMKELPLFGEFNELAEKLQADHTQSREHWQRMNQRVIQVEAGGKTGGARWIKTLLRAIVERKALRMRYEGYGKDEKTKRICPYVLKEYQGRWYMVAYDHNCERLQKTSVFALDCINELSASRAAYVQDPDFDAERYFKYSLGVWHRHGHAPVKVKLEFRNAPDIDQVRTEPLHASQRIIRGGKKGTLTVEIEVYETPELYRLILGYGSGVKVLTPESVADQVKAWATGVIQLYN